MDTDPVPYEADKRREYQASDRRRIHVPPRASLRPVVEGIREARKRRSRKRLLATCEEGLDTLARYYGVPAPVIVLRDIRPHRVQESVLIEELFGDYALHGSRIRLWTRTPRRRLWGSEGALLSTLLHEFAHHLDVVGLGYAHSYHTRGFYERVHSLYCAAREQPRYPIEWRKGRIFEHPRRWHVNWKATLQRKAEALAARRRPV